MTLEFGAAFADPGATATDTEDGTLAVSTSCNVNTQSAGTYTCSYTATDSGGLTDTATRTVVVNEQVASGWTCTQTTSSNWSHVSAGRAVNCSWSACAVGSGANMGLNNTYTTTTLAQVEEGYYVVGTCP
jgi:hypothetical protein